ncbi:523_t:CDS:2, partial [Scutellospora calospora]
GFVQKRDPRYKAYKMAAEQRDKAQIAEAKRRAARDRAKHLSELQEYQEQDWTKTSNWGYEKTEEISEDIINESVQDNDKIKSDSFNGDDELSELLNKTKISSRGGFESEEESSKTLSLNDDDNKSIQQEN